MAEKDKVYRCLNPTGTDLPVKLSPLAPRLDSLDGKTIHMSICGEQDIWYFLEKKLKTDYPNINWTVKKRYHIVPLQISEEERKTTDAVILGVCW